METAFVSENRAVHAVGRFAGFDLPYEIRDTLRATKQDELFTIFVSNLRDQMQKSGKIKINQGEMKKLTGPASRAEGE